jgi:hypothetical protein
VRYGAGTLVEAFVGSTRCAVASIRGTGFYIMSVVGPDATPGCAADAPITFVVDGERAVETARNSPARSAHLDLTVPRPG